VHSIPIFVDESGQRWKYCKIILTCLGFVLVMLLTSITTAVTEKAVLVDSDSRSITELPKTGAHARAPAIADLELSLSKR
jgi:uncharacterized protein YpmS